MTAELVPVENMAALETLDPQAREVAVTRMLSEARQWLAHAVEATEPARVSEFKAFVATIAETTRQLNLSKEIQLDATEMVRRAERGVGVAIRKGQEAGEIRTRGETRSHYNRWDGELAPSESATKPSPFNFATKDELGSAHDNGGIYAMTDGVSDEQFEEALTEAKSEGNLSRANVVRKVKNQAGPMTRDQRADLIRDLAAQGYSSRQMPSKVGVSEQTVRQIARDNDIEIPADKALSKTRRHDSTRIVTSIVEELASLHLSLDLIDYDDLDGEQAAEWATSLDESFKTLNSFRKQINRVAGR